MADIDEVSAEAAKLTIHQTKTADPPPAITHDHDPAGEEDAASVDYDSFDEQNYERPAERWAPLGAAVSPTPSPAEPRSVQSLSLLCVPCSCFGDVVLCLSLLFFSSQFMVKSSFKTTSVV